MTERFLAKQRRMSPEINQRSDLVEISWLDDQHAHVRLRCTGLVHAPDGRIVEHSDFHYGIHFSEHHLRYVNGLGLVTLLAPVRMWHSNASAPAVCIGAVPPGTEISDLVFQLFDVTVWNNHTVTEFDALNHSACRWARERMELFPVDARPLFWRNGDPVPLAPGAAVRGDWGKA